MKILFAFAHPDDESFGPCSTIQLLAEQGHDVTVASMCNGARPGATQVASDRRKAFSASCGLLGAKGIIHYNNDLTMSYTEVVNYAVDLVDRLQPEVLYTNNISDLNADHRLLAEACLIAARPKPGSSVKELYFCEIPGSTDWTFSQIHPTFEPNKFVDVSRRLSIKEEVIALYGTETYDYPDVRSLDSSIVLAMRRGSCVGMHAAEAFKQVFSVHREPHPLPMDYTIHMQ